MQRCYYHPKIEAIGQCRRCKLTVCFHCVEDDCCPECAKLRRYVQHGHSGHEPLRLQETPAPRRSITMELMLDRLHRQVFDESQPSARPPAALKIPRRLIDTEAQAGRKGSKPSRSLKLRPAKTRRPMAYGFLMPSVAPLVKVSRSPISRMAALLLVAFSLGTFFARQGAVSATVPPAETPVVQAMPAELPEEQPPVQTVEVQYKPVYIHVPVRQSARAAVSSDTPRVVPPAQTPRAAVRPAQPVATPIEPPRAISYPIASRQKFAAALEPTPTPLPPGPARLDVAYPHPGNVVRATPVIRVTIANPAKLALVNLAVDGTPVKAVPQISDTLEVPFDSTQFKNGEHTLQILAMEVDGGVISSPPVPITIRN